MIHVVIGQSGAGKTTHVKGLYIPAGLTVRETPLPHTVTEAGVILIGRYGIARRCEGTDTLSMSIGPRLRKVLPALVIQAPVLVMEGDRINNQTMLSYVLSLGEKVHLTLITTPLKTSLLRLREAGSRITLPFLRATRTKSHRNFALFSSRAEQSEIIRT